MKYTVGFVVIIISMVIMKVTCIGSNDGLNIIYHCDVANGNFIYNLDNMDKTSHDYKTYSYAIAEKDVKAVSLVATGASVINCGRKFAALSTANRDIVIPCPGLTQHPSKMFAIYLEETSIVTKNIIGGHLKIYDLPCDAAKFEIKVGNKLLETPVPPMVIAQQTPDILKMEIKTQPANRQIHIGDTLKVTISLANAIKPKILSVKSCDAARSSDMTSPLNLFTGNSGGSSMNEIVLQTPPTMASAIKTAAITFKLIAFEFSDSNTVYLRCTVDVCDTPQCPPSRRRKRSNSESAVTASFTVHDKNKDTSGQARVRADSVVASYLMVLTLWFYV